MKWSGSSREQHLGAWWRTVNKNSLCHCLMSQLNFLGWETAQWLWSMSVGRFPLCKTYICSSGLVIGSHFENEQWQSFLQRSWGQIRKLVSAVNRDMPHGTMDNENVLLQKWSIPNGVLIFDMWQNMRKMPGIDSCDRQGRVRQI